MTALLFRIALSGALSIASLLVVLFRVSPLLSPSIALPFFFLTLFLSVVTVSSLVFYGLWGFVPTETLDAGGKLTISIREAIFLGCATIVLLLFHLLSILTWWIGVLIYGVFLLIELALHA